MGSRSLTFLLSAIAILPAFSQSREVFVLDDSVSSSVFETLDFIEGAYEDNALVSSLSAMPYVSPGSPEGVLDMLLDAYAHHEDLFRHSITSSFGYREEYGRMHWGVDLAMDAGEGIAIPMVGKVVRTGYDEAGYGHFVIVAHPDGLETRYAHLREILVEPGDSISAGDIIATCGSTGNSTAPHLHFEVRRYGMPINPEQVFRFGR